MIIQSRRKFITGLVSFMAAPAIVKASSLMPVKTIDPFPEMKFNIEKILVTATSRVLKATWCYEETDNLHSMPIGLAIRPVLH